MSRQLAWFIAGVAWVVPMQSSVLSPVLLGTLHLRNLRARLLHGQLVFKDTAQPVIFYELGLEILLVLLVPNVCCDVHVVGVAGVLQLPGADVGHHDSHCEEAEEADHHQHIDDFKAAAGTANLRWDRAIGLLQLVLKQLGEEGAQGCVVRQHQHLFFLLSFALLSFLAVAFLENKKTRDIRHSFLCAPYCPLPPGSFLRAHTEAGWLVGAARSCSPPPAKQGQQG